MENRVITGSLDFYTDRWTQGPGSKPLNQAIPEVQD